MALGEGAEGVGEAAEDKKPGGGSVSGRLTRVARALPTPTQNNDGIPGDMQTAGHLQLPVRGCEEAHSLKANLQRE